MRIGIITALWKRHEVSEVVLRHYAEMEGFDFTLVAAGSEGMASRALAERCGWEYVEHPNEPLSSKFNAAALRMKDRVDAVLLIGSDDLLSPNTIQALIDEHENGTDVVGLKDLYYYDVVRDASYYCERAMPGAGMFISSVILSRVGWKPWPSGKNRGLDRFLINNLIKKGYPCKMRCIADCRQKGLALVDIKTPENMWSVAEMHHITQRVEQVPNSELDNLFPGLRELLTKP